MKRALSFVLALCLLIACVPLSASAASTLTAPTNAKWSTTTPGLATWDEGASAENVDYYEVIAYKVNPSGEDEQLANNWVESGMSSDFSNRISGSGDYYFTVRAWKHPDEAEAAMEYSDEVTSDTWTYTQPSQKLETVRSLAISGSKVTWAAPTENVESISGVQVLLYFKKTASGEFQHIATLNCPADYTSDDISTIYENEDFGGGEGYYTCEARFVSKDVTAIASSDWSARSNTYRYTKPTKKLGTPTVTWDFPNINYTVPTANASYINFLDLDVWYAANENDEPEYFVGTGVRSPESSGTVSLPEIASYYDKSLASGYYTIRARLYSTDVTKVLDGDEVESAVYHYEVPSAKLETVQNLVWNGTTVTYNLPTQHLDLVDAEFEYYFSETAAGTPKQIGYWKPSWGRDNFTGADLTGTENVAYELRENGSGYYTVKARFASTDITQVLDGEWATSAAYQYTAPSQKLQDVENLAWDGTSVTYDAPTANQSSINWTAISVFYSKTADGTPELLETWYDYEVDGTESFAEMFSTNFWNYKGTGYYWCDARYETSDPLTISNGDWSAMVGPYYYQKKSSSVVVVDDPEEPEEPEEPETPAVTFTDVPKDAWYYDAVAWAVANGITSGTDDGTTFSPHQECTRAQAVTFLWNAAGKPDVGATDKFTDVPANAWYAKAVAWAVANGVTSGTGDGTTFSPTDICDRAQIVTFMWNAAKKPAASQNSFTDVKTGSWYDQAVSWAVANEITSGVGGGKFGPATACDRAQIVTFLYNEATK